jgi:hypothetical protein
MAEKPHIPPSVAAEALIEDEDAIALMAGRLMESCSLETDAVAIPSLERAGDLLRTLLGTLVDKEAQRPTFVDGQSVH